MNEKQYPTINGRKYYVKAKETDYRKRVTVYNADKYDNFYKRGGMKNFIVNRIYKKGRFWYLGNDTTPPIEEIVQDTLNEAVCIREEKEEDEEHFKDKIEQAVSTVEEVHDE